MSRTRRNESLALIGVLMAAAAARLLWLGTVPPPMNQDEVGRAYDAWCLWRTGADHHGQRWPVLLRQFGPGDYSGALDAYLMAPFVGLLGPTPFAARLPVALLGTLSVAVLWWWVRREFDPVTAIAAAAFLALGPCHIHQSRLSVDVILVPTLITAALATLSAAGFRFRGNDGNRKAEDPLSWPLMLTAGALFALGLYSYISARLAVPVTLVALLLTFPRRIWQSLAGPRSRAGVWAFLVGLLATSYPFVQTWRHHPEQVLGRARQVSIFGKAASDDSPLATAIHNYFAHFDPAFLFMKGDVSPVNGPADLGLLHWYEVVLVPLGVIWALANARRNGMAKWCLVWLAIAPLPAALSVGVLPHAWRANGILPPLAVMSALAVAWGWRKLADKQRSLKRVAATVALFVVTLTGSAEAYDYFVVFPRTNAFGYWPEFAEAFRCLRQTGKRYDHCIVTADANQPYIFLLYFGRLPPEQWRHATVVREPGSEGFDFVSRVNEFYFVRPPVHTQSFEDVARRLAQSWSAGQTILLIARPYENSLGRRVHAVRGPGGAVRLDLREIRTDELR